MCMMASLAACGGSQAAPQGQPAESGAATVSTASDDTLVVAIWDNNQLAGLQTSWQVFRRSRMNGQPSQA